MKRHAFTVVELLVVIAIIGILIGLMLPAVQRVREASPRTMCLNNLRQITLASLNYESSHMKFPPCTGLPGYVGVGSADQLSGFVAILPFMEQNDRYEMITRPSVIESVEFPRFPPLHTKDYLPWDSQIPILICPDSWDTDDSAAPTHYGFCIGDRARNISNPNCLRGLFAGSLRATFGKITDGSSNTIGFGEIGSRIQNDPENPFAINQPSQLLENPEECWGLVNGSSSTWSFKKGTSLGPLSRGSRWADGRSGVALFNTILPPKSPSVAIRGNIGVDGFYSASGPHAGIVNITMFDGSTHSISVEIDVGESSTPPPSEEEMVGGSTSPYGAWGAMGLGKRWWHP